MSETWTVVAGFVLAAALCSWLAVLTMRDLGLSE